jgi:PEP-CTERM motif
VQKTIWVRTLCAVVLLTAFAMPARADLIVVDPNDFAVGTDLSTLFPGLTMAKLTNLPNSDGLNGFPTYQPVASPVYAVSTYHVPDGLSVGGHTVDLLDYWDCSRSISGSPWCGSSWNVLELRFDSPTDFLSIDTRFFMDTPDIIAYDAFGDVLDLRAQGSRRDTYSDLTFPGGWSFGTITVERTHADIARVVYGGYIGNTTPVRIVYGVPEPTTLGLMGLGLFGVALLKRRSGWGTP